MDKEIHDEFYEGIYEVFSIVFNDGENDGIDLYLFSKENTTNSIYQEKKIKEYLSPLRLVAKTVASMQPSGSEAESEIKDRITFTVPYKSLNDRGIYCQTEDDWEYLSKSYIKFHNAFYEVKKVSPNTYIEDSFMTVVFEVEYRKDIKELRLVE